MTGDAGNRANDEVVFSTPFFDVVSRPMPGSELPHYSLRTTDYVSVLALTNEGRVPLVRQLRPAVGCTTLEVPAGLPEAGESPEQAARRELLEESGYDASHVELMGRLKPDTGRLGNRMWCYFASGLRPTGRPAPADEGIERVEMTPREALATLRSGELDHALHLAVFLLGFLHGHLDASLLKDGSRG